MLTIYTLDDWFLKIFHGHLNYVSDLYCIGYSFGDPHVNDRLYDWLSFSAERKIIIVDPAVKEIPANFRHLKDQITLKKMGFLQFLNERADKNTLLKIKLFEQARKMSKEKVLKKQQNQSSIYKLRFAIKKVIITAKLSRLKILSLRNNQ